MISFGNKQLVLGSQSPRRKQLLVDLGLEFSLFRSLLLPFQHCRANIGMLARGCFRLLETLGVALGSPWS